MKAQIAEQLMWMMIPVTTVFYHELLPTLQVTHTRKPRTTVLPSFGTNSFWNSMALLCYACWRDSTRSAQQSTAEYSAL